MSVQAPSSALRGGALSPARQIEFLKRLRRMDQLGQCQVIMATQMIMEPCPDPDGLSGRPPAGPEQIRSRSRDDRADPAFPDHAGVLRGPGDVRGDDDGRVRVAISRSVLRVSHVSTASPYQLAPPVPAERRPARPLPGIVLAAGRCQSGDRADDLTRLPDNASISAPRRMLGSRQQSGRHTYSGYYCHEIGGYLAN